MRSCNYSVIIACRCGGGKDNEMEIQLKKEEYFEKCRALLKVLDERTLDDAERDALIWCARDYLDKLGEVTGITKRL